MSLYTNQNEIFKFVSVRPPKKALLLTAFIPYPKQSENSWAEKTKPLFIDNKQREKVKKQAKSFIESEKFYFSDQWYSKAKENIGTITQLIERQTESEYENHKMIQEIGTILATDIQEYIQSKEFLDAKQSLWDSLLAFSFVSGQKEDSRSRLLQAIRTVHIVEIIAAKQMDLSSYKSLNQIEKKTPIFPKVFSMKPVPTNSVELLDKVKKHREKKIQTIRDTYNQMVDLKQAIDELDHLHKQHKFNLFHNSKADEVVKKISLKDVDFPIKGLDRLIKQDDLQELSKEKINLQLVYTEMKASPWIIAPEITKSVSTRTKKILEQFNLDVNNERVDDIQEGLHSKLKQAGRELAQGDDKQSLVKIGQTYINDNDFDTSLFNEAIPKIAEDLKGYIPPSIKTNVEKWGIDPDLGKWGVIPPDSEILNSNMLVRPLGIGDLKVVEMELLKYEEGEISHIENILKSESKERSHRQLSRTEESVFRLEETVKESEKDLESTERFSLEREAEKVIHTDMQAEAGVTVTAEYGPVKISAHGGISTAQSQETSKRSSSSYAKEITQRSLSRVKERIQTERTQKSLKEFEEINKHGFDNTQGTEHVIGVYRWVDKLYEAKVINYGKRQMFSFMIPEPAAFYIHAQKNEKIQGNSLQKPEELGDLKHTDIDRNTYQEKVKLFRLTGVNPPPAENIVVSGMLIENVSDDVLHKISAKSNKESEIIIPDGYQAILGNIMYSFAGMGDEPGSTLGVILGNNYIFENDTSWHGGGKKLDNKLTYKLNNEIKTVPVSVIVSRVFAYIINYEVQCECAPETYAAWQIETYEKIIDAYERQMLDYKEKLSELRMKQERNAMYGENPKKNRTIEKDELKKLCIQYITHTLSFERFGAMKFQPSIGDGYPEMDKWDAFSEGELIQFFEQAFEWEHMTYLFYPYFWGRKKNWLNVIHYSDQDPLFEAFLKAGSAKVVLPVRLGYDEAVLHYLSTGEIWNGEGAPLIDDEMFLSIVEELKEEDTAVVEGEPWEVRVPTSLVKLQTGSELPNFTQRDSE